VGLQQTPGPDDLRGEGTSCLTGLSQPRAPKWFPYLARLLCLDNNAVQPIGILNFMLEIYSLQHHMAKTKCSVSNRGKIPSDPGLPTAP